MHSVSPIRRITIAFLVAITYGLPLYLLIWSVGLHDDLPFFTGLLLMPMGIASVATAVSDPLGQRSLSRHIVYSFIVIAALVILTMIFFREGGICVVMAAPFFMLGATLGCALTLWILRRLRSPASTMLVIALPLLGTPIQPQITYPEHSGEVKTVIEINAPPSKVWANTVEIPEIAPSELPYTFSHDFVGAPHPQSATLEQHGVGGVRQLRWSKGIRFEEIITTWEQDRRLGWNFRFGPGSIPPAVEAHISVDSSYLKLANGDYVLEALPGERTRLTLTTRYQIVTPINAYCDLWGHIFLNDFHGAVLKVIKDRSERSKTVLEL